jgi:hypothetical protein
VIQLLSSAVQGCLLKIKLTVVTQHMGLSTSQQVIEDICRAHTALVAEKGCRNVPVLSVDSSPY